MAEDRLTELSKDKVLLFEDAAGIFDCHADAAVQCRAHCPMEHIQEKPLDDSIWQVPALYCPSGHHGGQFRRKTKKNTTKKLFLAS